MRRLVLAVILILAFALRFVSLTKYPVGFNADEASFGYDAYSILHTGRDQWGTLFPIVLKSFGDYKSPLYSYLATPTVGILGLNVFAVRLPGVLIGVLAILAVYFLFNEIYKKTFTKYNLPLGLLPAFLLAVNPWHIMLSRGAFEANLITFFLPMGILFFIKGVKDSKFFIYSAIFFGLNLFTYHSSKLLTPVVIISLIVIYWKKLNSIKFAKVIPALIIFLIFFSGLLYTFKVGGGSRISERSIIQGALEQGAEEKIRLINAGTNPTLAKLMHNKYQVIAQRFITNYFQYFSYKFFITNGAGEGYYGMIPGIGTVYLIDLFLLAGSLIPLFRKETRWIVTVLFLWLLIGPLPAALSSGAGYTGTRSEGMLPALQIIEAFGVIGWLSLFKKNSKKLIPFAGVIIIAVLLFELKNFAMMYFRFPSNDVAKSMLYGNLEIASWVNSNKGQKSVLISRGMSEPQIFIAFTTKWDPGDFQRQTKTWNFDKANVPWLDQLPEWKLGTYTFKSIAWKTDGKLKDTLIVVRPGEIPADIPPLKLVLYPNGSPAIMVVDPNQKVYAQAF